MITTINPSTEEIIQQYTLFKPNDIEVYLNQSHKQFINWKETKFKHRSSTLLNIAEQLLKQKQFLANLITTEMGKPITAALAEIEKCALVCRHYAEHGPSFLQQSRIPENQTQNYVCYQPLGPLLAIMPWNYPFWQVFRFAAPNIMAGNTVLLKHAPNCTGCAIAIEDIFKQANCPNHLLQTLIIDIDPIESIIADHRVAGVTLTGSPRAGRSVAKLAGKHLKPCVLELGGTDPYIVLADADLDLAAQLLTQSRLNNSGQVCIAAKRIIAETAVMPLLEEKILTHIQNYRVGDPINPDTQMGPLARADLLDTVEQQVKTCVTQGALLRHGGQRLDCKGFYYSPTLLTQVTHDSLANQQEIFGPIVTLFPVENEEQAIALANQSQYGLGAGIFTQRLDHGHHIAQTQLQAGACTINCCVSSDPNFPFGGIKQSGFGRELGQEGVKAFVNIKSVIQAK